MADTAETVDIVRGQRGCLDLALSFRVTGRERLPAEFAPRMGAIHDTNVRPFLRECPTGAARETPGSWYFH